MLQKIQNIIYPQKCGICGKINEKALCKKCQKILENEAIWKIEENQNPYIFFNELISIFKYDGIIREKILDYKFNEKSYLYKMFVNFLLKDAKIFEKIKEYDIIIPVPISKKRKKERGYNQSELIAKEISKIIKVPIAKNILYKIKNTVPQSSLNKEQREQNAKGVYMIKNQQKIINKKILLIDDIYTTGSTINECAKVIVQQGISREQIGVLTIAKD